MMRRLLRRLAVLALILGALVFVPVPAARGYQRTYNGIVAFVVVGGIGKILYDTLFYDHYEP